MTVLLRRALMVAAAGIAALAPGASAGAAGKEYVVTMSNMSFGRIPGGLKVGDTIVWVNRDTVLHSITAKDKSFDLRTQVGGRARLTLKKAGTIAIYCIYHPAMRGSLKVAS